MADIFGGGGGGTTQTTQTVGLPDWEQRFADQYLAAMLNYVFAPQAPPNQFNAPGSFPSPSQVAGSTSPAAQSPAGQMMQQIDPTGTAYSLLSPMISGSPYLQQLAAQNPGAIVGATSPMASAQLSNPNIYGSSNPYLSWIPGLSLGLGGGSAPPPAAAPSSPAVPAANNPQTVLQNLQQNGIPGGFGGGGPVGVGGGFGGFGGIGGLGGITAGF